MGLIGWVTLIIWDRPAWTAVKYWKDRKKREAQKGEHTEQQENDGDNEIQGNTNNQDGAGNAEAGHEKIEAEPQQPVNDSLV